MSVLTAPLYPAPPCVNMYTCSPLAEDFDLESHSLLKIKAHGDSMSWDKKRPDELCCLISRKQKGFRGLEGEVVAVLEHTK